MPKHFKKESKENRILVAGLGASAGGLQALQKFFESLPEKTGMAFIVVLHLAPEKKSNLAEILQTKTSLKTLQVKKRTKIESDHVYVIPPDKLLSVENNHLELSESEKEHRAAAIDLLFRTLAEKKQKYSAGLLFSGTGSDGTTGLKIIKEQGGITIAQDPAEAKHPAMPEHAINVGVIDKVLPAKDMAEELFQYRKSLDLVQISEQAEELSEQEETEKILSEIFEKIQSWVNHDFSNYRRPSILRRIDRRMRLNRVQSLSAYLNYLNDFPEETDLLYKDLLISVTNFFRDPKAFEALKKKVIPKLFENKDRNNQVRVWVPGCATGEEAYSIAILLKEYAEELDTRPELLVFASDVDNTALDKARAGRYPKTIEKDVPERILRQYFEKNEEEYIVKQELRDVLLFSSHDLLRTPPFSRLDLISCRNLLIYLNRDLQSGVFNLFHYSLRSDGWLFLGKSDSKGGVEELFTTVDKEYRIYRQKSNLNSRIPLPDMPLLYKRKFHSKSKNNSLEQKKNLEKIHWGILSRLFAPQSVLISQNFEVLHSTDGINKYLEYSGGEPSRNILDMVKPEIRQVLRTMLFQLKSKEPPSVQNRIQINVGNQTKKLALIVRKFSDKEFPEGLIHIVFKEISEGSKKKSQQPDGKEEEPEDEEIKIIESLENELDYTKEQLQLSVEEYEISNEELRASNEELQSMNEELQSTTEELETSKEELQSVNEELKTVNEQLESKVEELSRAHSDLENLMETTEVGIIFVDRDLCVQRFTSAAKEIFNLIPSDTDRPLQHITHSLNYNNLLGDITQVLKSLDKIKKAVTTTDGLWFLMRMRPYRSTQNKIEGVVLSFTNYTELKNARETIKEQQHQESLAALGVYALEQNDPDMVIQRAIQQSCAIMNLKCAALLMLNHEKKAFQIAFELGCGCKEPEVENTPKWDVGYALASKKPVHVKDYSKETRFRMSPLMEKNEFSSGVHIAIRGSEKVYGVFALYSKPRREFTQQELHFIQVIANILGRTIEQKNAKEELQKMNTRLQQEKNRSEQYQKEILNNSVLERWELGSYLHDNLGQLLASAKILTDDITLKLEKKDIELPAETGELNKILDMSMKGIRDIVHEIIPVDIEKEGVAQAFRLLMTQSYRLYNIDCELQNRDLLDEIKNREIATHLYLIVQEAMKNAATHGKAKKIIVTVDRQNDRFILQIKDDGIGYSTSKMGNGGKGLRIMKHRMDLMEGTFEINEYSEADKSGTVITCRIPYGALKSEEKK